MALLLVALSVAVPTPKPADAALSNLFPADVDGFPKGRFYSDEALYVTLVSDFYGGVVCIVDAAITNPASADCVNDVAWGKPRTFTGLGTMLGYPLKAPWLTAGEWRLLTVPALKAKDALGTERPVPGTELSEVFVVEACGPCDRSWADDELQPWKDMAGNMKSLGQLTQAAEAYDAASKVYGIAKNMYTGAGFGLSGMLFGGLAGGAGLALDSMGIKSTESMAKDLFKGLAGRVGTMYADIAADPPRFDYDVATVPQFETVDQLVPDASMTAAEAALANSYFDAMSRAAAYGDASRLANERYQGAVIDGDHEAAYEQALATSTFTFKLNQQLRLVQLYEAQIIGQSWVVEKNVTLPGGETWADVLAEIDLLRTSGLTPAQQAALDAELASCTIKTLADECLITQALVDQALASWQDPAWFASLQAVDPNGSLADVLAANSAKLDDAIAAFEQFGQWMAHNASLEADQIPATPANRAPRSAFDATALTGPAPLTVTFTSQATDPDGDVLDLTWDIAGTRRVDDQTSVAHTFTTPGSYGISLVATDPDGAWDQAIKWITVYPGAGVPDPEPENQAPVASFSPQWVDKVGPFTQTFTASSFDPDGDNLTHSWYFGDGTTETGKSVTKTFPPGFVMSVLLVSSDGILSGQVAGEVTSRHPGVDPTPNEPPVVGFVADPASGNSPLEVSFASTSTDADGDPLSHTWYFGDGDTATGANATHTYTTAGTYTATLVVGDGGNSASATRQIVVHAVTPISAAFAVARGGDVAATTYGGRILDTGTSTRPGSPVTNLILPTSAGWYSATGVTEPQEIIFDLAGRGRDLVDQIVLRGADHSASVKTFSVELVQGSDPAGAAITVIDHAALDRAAGDQTFTFAPQRARFVKLTVHDNYGANYLRLDRVSVPAVGGADGAGGIVSLAAGNPASIVAATTEHSAAWAAANILNSGTSQWSSAVDATTDQRLRVRLGGEGAHELSTIALRSSGNAYTVGDFEVYASPTGDDGSWTKVLDDTMAPTNAAQSFTLATPTEARFLELRLNGTGAGRYLYLAELRALTSHGLNVADGDAVGAQLVDSSSSYPGYFAASVLAPDTNSSRWLSAPGQNSDQFLTVLLRNGDVATVDRVSVRSGTARPRNVKVQTSLDGVNFTTVAVRELLNIGDERFISFPPVAARFVKLVLEDGYTSANIGLDKFRVFSPERGAAADVPFVDLSTGTKPAVSWLWDFGDGTTSTQQHPTHTFPGPGTYSVTLAVTDGDGNTATSTHPYVVPGVPTTSMTATVATEAPDGTFTIGEGTFTTLRASTAGEPIVAWDWDFDYTKPTTTAATTSARFPDQGTYTVRHRGLTADWLWTPWAERTFVVHNLPPTVNAGVAQSGQALDPIKPQVATISDPAGAADPVICTWEWGDGTASDTVNSCNIASAKVPHAYSAAGTYTATLTVDDGDGGVTTGTVQMDVRHRPLIVQITDTAASGSDRTTTLRVLDATTGAPVPGRPVQVSADASTPVTATTDADGFATVTIPGASGAELITATVEGTAVYAPMTLARPVRAPKADIVFIIDESASMGGYQDKVVQHLRTIIGGLTSTLDFRIGTVGYAAGDINGFGRVRAPLTDDLTNVYAGLRRHSHPSWSANGYEGIVVGSGFTYNAATDELVDTGAIGQRRSAASCAVLITDAAVSEAGPDANVNGPLADYDAAYEALQRRATTLFSIIPTWHAQTSNAYGTGPGGLAGLTGGDQWSISDFSNDPSNVLDALAAKCITKAQTPDLAAAIDGPTTPVAPGDEITYAVTASNDAAIDVPAVTLTATLPADVEYLYSAGGGIWDAATRTVSWPTFDLAAGEQVQREITVRVRAHEWDAGDHPLIAGATVSYNGSLGAESDTANNSGDHTLTVHVDAPIGPSTTTTSTTVPPTTTSTAPTTSVPGSTTTSVPRETTITTTPPATPPTLGPAPPIDPVAVASEDERALRDGIHGVGDAPLPRTGAWLPVPATAALGLVLMLVGASAMRARRAIRRG